jgi:hypothetical protein
MVLSCGRSLSTPLFPRIYLIAFYHNMKFKKMQANRGKNKIICFLLLRLQSALKPAFALYNPAEPFPPLPRIT